MSDVKRLDVARGLALLGRLDGVLEEFGRAERELGRELRLRGRDVERAAQDGIAAAVVEDERGAGELRELLAGERDRLAAVKDGRRDRIEVAGRDALRTLPRRAQEERERWLGKLQMRHVSRSRELAGERGVALDARATREAELAVEIGNKMERADAEKAAFDARERERLGVVVPRALSRNERLVDERLARLENGVGVRLVALEVAGRAAGDAARGAGESARGEFESERAGRWEELEARWDGAIRPIYEEIADLNAVAAEAFPAWTEKFVAGWEAAGAFLPATKFARLEVNLPMAGERLELPGPPELSIPLALAYPETGSLLFETRGVADHAVMSCLNQVILRLLATTPPGKLNFTILDPVGLGQNFAGLMHLGDYEETLITRRIWTQSEQIEERLAELNAHIEKVIQMYLRDEYATIAEYNARAGSTAEKVRFLVVADFPAGFSETAIKRLQSVITSGPRCGVHTLIHWDQRQTLPTGFPAEELRSSSVCVQGGKDGLELDCGAVRADARLVLDPVPSAELGLKFIEVLGSASIDSNRVEVPFSQIAPEMLWEGETTRELRVAIGRSGATKQQMLAIGKGTRQHALIAGKTGSGKSTLFHVIVTNLALTCSPREVEFYLIDFKKGVEFKCYATKRLPHARVVAVESDREFGLSVLERLDEELRRRGDLFRKAGVQDLAGYRREAGAGGDGEWEVLPRTLLMIDEFQEFFVEDDATAQGAAVLLDRIVRQGRAFGIHVILGSQTLGGAYSLARTTLGQMAIRVALQCNEADAYLIMDDDNPAPRLLSRPGEGIYNDSAGAMEGNSPFQVCWLSDEERDAELDRVRAMAEAEAHPEMDHAPVVFEGNAPAEVRENAVLAHALRVRPTAVPSEARVWLGAPNSIKGPTEARFARQSGSNLLIVGQREDAALAMLGTSLVALAAQYPVGGAKFVWLHALAADSADGRFVEELVGAIGHEVTVGDAENLEAVLAMLGGELERRKEGGEAGGGVEIFVFVHGLQRFRKLRAADEFDFSMSESGPSAASQFGEVIAEGSGLGLHVLASVDGFNSVGRFVNRKALSEFEMRVVFQMSANDSASLIDSPRAGNLGLHRAILYSDHSGAVEIFRPYALPDAGWVEEVATALGGMGVMGKASV